MIELTFINFFYDEDELNIKMMNYIPQVRILIQDLEHEKVEIIEEPQEHKIPEKIEYHQEKK